MSNTIGLYVHIPFCKSKCGYCDFASYSGCADKEDAYISAVIKEAERYAEDNLTAETVYIGGGTPSVLKEGNLKRLVDGISEYINIEAKEFTVEANPESFSKSKACEYRAVGANRLSMGLQATQPELLKAIGRIHSYSDFLDALNNARDAGFTNISADLMYSLPGQTVDMAKESAQKLASLELNHISAYALKLEPGVPMYGCDQPGDDEDREMFYAIKDVLAKAGFARYEISNFSKPGFESKHNLKYWLLEDYIGLGLGAHSCYGGERFGNMTDLKKYIRSAERGKKLKVSSQPIGDVRIERVMLETRLVNGVPLSVIGESHAAEIVIDQLVKHELAKVEEGRLILTDAGLDVQNAIVVKIWEVLAK